MAVTEAPDAVRPAANETAEASVRREVLTLVVLVVIVDAIFIGVYFLAKLLTMPTPYKVGYTLLWTFLTLAVVVRGLNRIRRARIVR
jgi:hypothetical protein